MTLKVKRYSDKTKLGSRFMKSQILNLDLSGRHLDATDNEELKLRVKVTHSGSGIKQKYILHPNTYNKEQILYLCLEGRNTTFSIQPFPLLYGNTKLLNQYLSLRSRQSNKQHLEGIKPQDASGKKKSRES